MDIEFNKHACTYASVHIFLLRKILILCDLLIYSRSFFCEKSCFLSLLFTGKGWEHLGKLLLVGADMQKPRSLLF